MDFYKIKYPIKIHHKVQITPFSSKNKMYLVVI